jgi:hypothetical protein
VRYFVGTPLNRHEFGGNHGKTFHNSVYFPISCFRSGSVIADLFLTTSGILSQEMYDTLKFAIVGGKLGNLAVALVPGM